MVTGLDFLTSGVVVVVVDIDSSPLEVLKKILA